METGILRRGNVGILEYQIANVCFAITKKLDKKTEIKYNIYTFANQHRSIDHNPGLYWFRRGF